MFMNPLNQYATVKELCRWPVCLSASRLRWAKVTFAILPFRVAFVQRQGEMIPGRPSHVKPSPHFFRIFAPGYLVFRGFAEALPGLLPGFAG
jgi:hypothetical protein